MLQIRKFQPKMVAIRDAAKIPQLKEMIKDVREQPEILAGDEGAVEVARHPECEAVVTGERPGRFCYFGWWQWGGLGWAGWRSEC